MTKKVGICQMIHHIEKMQLEVVHKPYYSYSLELHRKWHKRLTYYPPSVSNCFSFHTTKGRGMWKEWGCVVLLLKRGKVSISCLVVRPGQIKGCRHIIFTTHTCYNYTLSVLPPYHITHPYSYSYIIAVHAKVEESSQAISKSADSIFSLFRLSVIHELWNLTEQKANVSLLFYLPLYYNYFNNSSMDSECISELGQICSL